MKRIRHDPMLEASTVLVGINTQEDNELIIQDSSDRKVIIHRDDVGWLADALVDFYYESDKVDPALTFEENLK